MTINLKHNDTDLVIDLRDLQIWSDEAGKLAFDPEAEKSVVKLLELQKAIDAMVEQVRLQIAENAEKVMPGFKGVVGEQIKAIYRVYGGAYAISDAEKINKQFLSITEKIGLNTTEVKKYIEENDKLPDGVAYRDRAKKLSLVFLNEKEDATNEET